MIDHVLVAWNGSLEASHAVFGVLPLLHAATCVSIFSVRTPENDRTTGAELAEALSWQGIPTHEASAPRQRARSAWPCSRPPPKAGATLIVMGAYTHSRWRHSFLGGVTMHVLSESAVPVVMSH